MKFIILIAFLVAVAFAYPASEPSENSQDDQILLNIAALEPNNVEINEFESERAKRQYGGYGGYGGRGGGYGGYGGGRGHGGYGGYGGGHRGGHRGGYGK